MSIEISMAATRPEKSSGSSQLHCALGSEPSRAIACRRAVKEVHRAPGPDVDMLRALWLHEISTRSQMAHLGSGRV
jgi:hypothetical protein